MIGSFSFSQPSASHLKKLAAFLAIILLTGSFALAQTATPAPKKGKGRGKGKTATANPQPVDPAVFKAAIRTPPTPPTPRINGPAIFGVRPGAVFLYHIPASGTKPMEYAADGLPDGLKLDAKTGWITGKLAAPGEHSVTLRAKNSLGEATKKFKIVAGETIALTPPMGWCSWNAYGSRVSADKVLLCAKGMVDSGLIDHGFTYINIDDAWQSDKRGGPFHAIMGNEKFPDMQGMCDAIHAMGLKPGIYSTPWVTSYARHMGGSAENPEGTWIAPTGPKTPNKKILPWAIGKYHFTTNDVKQWAVWGFDYLKYDWNPNEIPETKEIYDALRASGRDVVLSISNHTPYQSVGDLSKYANLWRTGSDIKENWTSMRNAGFSLDKWASFCKPGHWNDPDMLVVGTSLTPDEQYTNVSLWCLASAPLLLSYDLSKTDEFTRSLLSNDEVLAVDQDTLGVQATCISGAQGDLKVYAKDLEDGTKAVGLFNTGTTAAPVTATWADLKLTGSQPVRDLWRQKDLGSKEGQIELTVAPHGAELLKIGKAKAE